MSEKNIENAKKIVNSFNPSGGTNIETALDVALKLHKNSKLKDERQPMIMFLTDGQATVGQTNSDLIVSKVRFKNITIPKFGLQFIIHHASGVGFLVLVVTRKGNLPS